MRLSSLYHTFSVLRLLTFLCPGVSILSCQIHISIQEQLEASALQLKAYSRYQSSAYFVNSIVEPQAFNQVLPTSGLKYSWATSSTSFLYLPKPNFNPEDMIGAEPGVYSLYSLYNTSKY